MIYRGLFNVQSHPLWVRGLKPTANAPCPADDVAPFVGAWIETNQEVEQHSKSKVAPFVGAWIETPRNVAYALDYEVAPFVGAWIETIS